MAEQKIFKSLVPNKTNDKFKAEFGQGVISFVSWDRMLPHIGHLVDRKVDEAIEGIKITEDGIHVKIVKKNGNRR